MDNGEKSLGKGVGAWCSWGGEIFCKKRGYNIWFPYNWVDELENDCVDLNCGLPLRRRRRKPSLPARYGLHLPLRAHG